MVWFDDERIHVELMDGRALATPLTAPHTLDNYGYQAGRGLGKFDGSGVKEYNLCAILLFPKIFALILLPTPLLQGGIKFLL